MEKQECFYTVGGSVNQFNHCGIQCGDSSRIQKEKYHLTQESHIHPKDYKTFYYKDTCTRIFIAALFTIAKRRNQPKCPSMIEWTRKMWHIHTVEYYAAIKNYKFKHHSLQTDTRTEDQTQHVFTNRQVLNNENTWTQGGEHHTLGSVEGE